MLEKVGQVECDQAFTCKASFPTDVGVTFEQAFGADQSACYADAAAYYDAAAVEAGITADRIGFDATAAADCLAGLSSAAAPVCTTFWTEGPAFPDACYTVFTGKVASGGACTIDFECSGELLCGDTSKTCEAAPAGARKAPINGLALHPKQTLPATRAD